ncbi:MAG: chromosomal replication initiator protein DnaA [Candidatus Shapirobacteria bacterium]
MDSNKIWRAVLGNLKINLSPASFNTWFSQTFIVTRKTLDTVRQITEIGCPSLFIRDTVETKYYGLIKDALDQVTQKKNDLIFLVKQNETIQSHSVPPLFAEKPPEEKSNLEPFLQELGLRPDFSFDTFAVSATNQMAFAAATAVADSPSKAYNPLFLYGGTGVGKTHLMQAIGLKILQKSSKTKLLYCTGEEFTNGIVLAIKQKNTNEFKDRYRSVKVLLIDDIQFIAGRHAVQEEFFHTFNAITKSRGQIVMTSDRKPDEIDKIDDRLRSRFEGGLTIDIQKPDFELRAAILLIKAQQKGLELPMAAAQLIAGNIISIRRMEGFLARLIGESKVKNTSPFDLDFISALLGKTQEATVNRPFVRPRQIINAVGNFFSLKQSELAGERRLQSVVLPRQILMYLLRSELRLQYKEIGRLLGGRDHTTIIHGVEKITHNLSTNEQLRVDIAGIKKHLYG